MTSPRTVLLAGASGLVGREILAGLLSDPQVAQVHTLGRRPLPPSKIASDKHVHHVVDFAALPALPPAQEVYLALGTTIKVAGSQQAFKAVDYDANLAVAQAARKAGATRLGLVSAMGADPKSGVFYSRTKGELEVALDGLGYEAVVIARPSMLAGDRESLGQPVRGGEILFLKLSNTLKPLIPANYRAIDVRDVAGALLREVPRAQGKLVMLSGAMQGQRVE